MKHLLLGVLFMFAMSMQAFHGSHSSHSSHHSSHHSSSSHHSGTHMSHYSTNHGHHNNATHHDVHSSPHAYHYNGGHHNYSSYTRPTIHQRIFRGAMFYYFVMRNHDTNNYDTIKSQSKQELETKIASMKPAEVVDDTSTAEVILIAIFIIVILVLIGLSFRL